MSQVILISIHPKHVDNILSGKKVFEYRKTMPTGMVSRIALYCTVPVKKIVAIAEVLDYVKGSRTHVWESTACGAGIPRSFFRNYFSEHTIANAFILGNVFKLRRPVDLSELSHKKYGPQSFLYLDEIDSSFISRLQNKSPVVPQSTIFVGGIHGVGKDRICKKAFEPAGYKCITASSLIASSGLETDHEKIVDNIGNNQKALLREFSLVKEKYCRLLLDGHFTLINSKRHIEPITPDVFQKMGFNKLILIKGHPWEIAKRLKDRDGMKWDTSFLAEFQAKEEAHAQYISEQIGIPLYIFNNDIKPSALVKAISSSRSDLIPL